MEPYVFSQSSDIIYFRPSETADYSVTLKTDTILAGPKSTKVAIPQSFWTHTMLCQYLTSQFANKKMKCTFVARDVKQNRDGNKIDLTGIIKCMCQTTANDKAFSVELSHDFKTVWNSITKHYQVRRTI